MRPIATNVVRSVCHDPEPCKTAELIEMPFGTWVVGSGEPKKALLDGGQIAHTRGNYEGERGGPL